MQVTLDAYAMKPFARALTCLSRYGDDLTLVATPESLTMSCTHASLSAYCRFNFIAAFFSQYRVGDRRKNQMEMDEVEEVPMATGQLITKSLLSVLKHRTIEKTVERCELSIVDGVPEGETGADEEEERDSLESRLVVRLHCKHGKSLRVVKTHRLPLLTPTSFMTPAGPDTENESRLTVGPRTLRGLLEHFPTSRNADPQLIWRFDRQEVHIKSYEPGLDAKGRGQLTTELTIGSEEFEMYHVYSPPITIAFHLREFNATIAYAEASSVLLDLRFTTSSAPLYIDADGDGNAITARFVISTSRKHPQGRTSASPPPTASSSSTAGHRNPKRARESEPPERFGRSGPIVKRVEAAEARAMEAKREQTPLFLPGSQAEAEVRAAGLGIENMNRDELIQLLEGDGEEVNGSGGFGDEADANGDFGGGDIWENDGMGMVGLDAMQDVDGGGVEGQTELDGGQGGAAEGVAEGRDEDGEDSLDFYEDSVFPPTQVKSGGVVAKSFQPLFED